MEKKTLKIDIEILNWNVQEQEQVLYTIKRAFHVK